MRKINWNPKYQNLREVADELSLGHESLAFTDDSNYEREQMCQFLPDVLILNEISDPLHTLHSLWETDAFDSLIVTEEDRARHYGYSIRPARGVAQHGEDVVAFLQSLEMEATFEEIGPANMERALALPGKA